MIETTQNISFLSNTEIASLLADRIKKERIAQNYRQSDIAKRAGIPSGTYAYFERTGKISIDKLISVVRALGKIKVLTDFLDFDKERLEADAYEWTRDREHKLSKKRVSIKGSK